MYPSCFQSQTTSKQTLTATLASTTHHYGGAPGSGAKVAEQTPSGVRMDKLFQLLRTMVHLSPFAVKSECLRRKSTSFFFSFFRLWVCGRKGGQPLPTWTATLRIGITTLPSNLCFAILNYNL